MANENMTCLVGNLTGDPELRYTQNGIAVANFTVAVQERKFDKTRNEYVDGDTLFLRASVWREFAENIAGSLTKGTRVIVTGKLRQRSFETKEGEKRSAIELDVDAIGPDLRYATAAVTRVQGGNRPSQATSAPSAPANDAWAPSGANSDETPW